MACDTAKWLCALGLIHGTSTGDDLRSPLITPGPAMLLAKGLLAIATPLQRRSMIEISALPHDEVKPPPSRSGLPNNNGSARRNEEPYARSSSCRTWSCALWLLRACAALVLACQEAPHVLAGGLTPKKEVLLLSPPKVFCEHRNEGCGRGQSYPMIYYTHKPCVNCAQRTLVVREWPAWLPMPAGRGPVAYLTHEDCLELALSCLGAALRLREAVAGKREGNKRGEQQFRSRRRDHDKLFGFPYKLWQQ